MSSWKDDWERFSVPMKQSIENFKDDLSYFIEDAREGEIDKEFLGGCLVKIAVVVVVLFLLFRWGGGSENDTETVSSASAPKTISSTQSDFLRESSTQEKGESNTIRIVQNGYLGEYTDMTVQELLTEHYKLFRYDEETWESSTTDSGDKVVTVTYTDDGGEEEDVTIQFTMLDDECFKITSFSDPLHPLEKAEDLMRILNYFYFEQYGAKHPEIIGTEDEAKFVKSLERIDGFVVQYGASADYKGDRRKICEIAGDLPSEGTVVEVLQESGLVDMSAYYPTPTPVPTPEPTPEPDLEPVYSGYEKYYGYYEYSAAYIYLDRGLDEYSFYVHVHFEPTAPWSRMHANVVPDGESYFTFYSDGIADSESIVADKDMIAGAVSLEEVGGNCLRMVLYKDQYDENPYIIDLIP